MLIFFIFSQSSVDNRVIVDELMASYLGIITPTKPVIGKATVVSPVGASMKQKILQYLTRSTVAPVAYMNNMKVTYMFFIVILFVFGFSPRWIPKLCFSGVSGRVGAYFEGRVEAAHSGSQLSRESNRKNARCSSEELWTAAVWQGAEDSGRWSQGMFLSEILFCSCSSNNIYSKAVLF